MISPMRFFVLILLVLLLPLSGGMGGAMAAEVPHHGATQQHQQHQAAGMASDRAATASFHGHLEDCGGHTKPQLDAAKADTQTADPACDACSACQSCHAVGLAFSGAHMQPLPAPNAQPAALSPEFVSAHAARDQKPPIA